MKQIARGALAVALALASGTAAALGLGQIEVKSRAGQPLVAEIPIISSDPTELEGLLVGPASPETFARIGLTPPQGIVADLQFMLALDNAGNPVIRVTTVQPVNQPLLTFLVEVESVQGRLVREYSALVDTPQTVAAPLQPPVDAPVVSGPDLIERPLEPSVAEVPATDPAANPETTSDDIAGTATEGSASPTGDIAAAPEAPAPVAAVPEPAFSPSPSTDAINVQRGDTLSALAGQLDLQGMSLDQAMIALLRANPDAFIGDNVNRLKAGAVLRIPDGGELAAVDAGEASALVRSQVRQWRQAQRPVPQPAIAESTASDSAASDSAGEASSTASSSRAAGARLEIVPPGASKATQAGNQSGISAGGGGEMLRQELQQNQETLAARDAEVQELKSRLAELEKLQQQQQQLIAMKDTELAAAQKRLADSNQAASNQVQAAKPAEAQMGVMPWLLGGGGVLLAALLGGWLLRRRAANAPRFRPPNETPSPLAAGFPAATEPRGDLFTGQGEPERPLAPTVATDTADNEPIRNSTRPAAAGKPADARPAAQPTAPLSTAPQSTAPQPMFELQATAVAPTWHVGGAAAVTAVASNASTEQLELARAYLDLGDRDNARQLLGEVVLHGDLEARQHAARMLRDLE